MCHLKEIHLKNDVSELEYPFSIPVVRTLEKLELQSAVTFFVGENGSGKSTLLEALAAAAELPAVGSADIESDDSMIPARRLASNLTLSWKKRVRKGFFMRAEDFFGFVKKVSGLKNELEEYGRDFDKKYKGWGLKLAKGAVSTGALTAKYGENPDARSHGESFLQLFESRLKPDGLYLLDEPEAPLSPQRQLSLMVMIHDSLSKGCQFIIATHSPVLMAFPGAVIYNFDDLPLKATAYENLEHVNFTRNFLNHPENYLRHLFK
ncbi:MAG: AAA family ATPase [Candidatus Wallbacteria bacterium]|nr:AAA family ATPase [Candidatus Wallbacteria bacterium]